MRWRIAALSLLWCSVHAGAQAQAGAACVPTGAPEQRNACALRDFQASDAALSIRYNAVMQSLPAVQRHALRREHSTWIQTRQSLCRASHGDSQALVDGDARYHACLIEQNEERQQALLSRSAH